MSLSNNSDREEKFLKINYQDSKENFEVEIESDGRILFEDITSMDSKVVGLVLQSEGSRRLIKPKNGYLNEPKEKWETFMIFAFLNNQSDDMENENAEEANACLSKEGYTVCGELKTIKAELPSNRENEVGSSHNPIIITRLPSAVNADYVKSEAPEPNITTATVPYEHESAFEACGELPNDSAVGFNPAVIPPINGPNISGTAAREPTNEELFAAYNVSSYDELKMVLCRGNHDYYKTFALLLNHFKKTLLTNKNIEIARYVWRAHPCNMLLKDLGLAVTQNCDVCKTRKEALTLKHLVTKEHANEYRQVYGIDPPEVARLCEPEIHKQYISHRNLTVMKIPEFKAMEESSAFSLQGCSDMIEATKLKYTLICRILDANMEMPFKESFSIEKLLYLQKNFQSLMKYFTVELIKCRKQCKSHCKNYAAFVRHILTPNHFQNSLTQEQLNDICKVVSFIQKDHNGLLLQPSHETNARKRQFEPPTSSYFPAPDYKRYRNEF